jgi:16S rRNA processing protein RimM
MTDDEPALSEPSEPKGRGDLLLVGRVARAHGNRGQVIVNLDTDFAEDRFRAGAVLFVGADAAPRRIREVRFHQGRPIVSLEGVDTMDDAEALAGADLKIAASTLPPLPEGTYYRHDLVGCEVRDEANTSLGRVADVEGPMERSVLVVDGPHGELLIPLAADICTRIDMETREIVVRMPDGLLELNRTKKS